MPIESRRKYTRIPHVSIIKYYVEKFEEPHANGVSVDISQGGLRMITYYPLHIGDILFFEDVIKINKIVAKGSLVRWSKETEKNRYVVGTEFVS